MVVNVFAEGGILGGNDDASTIANPVTRWLLKSLSRKRM